MYVSFVVIVINYVGELNEPNQPVRVYFSSGLPCIPRVASVRNNAHTK